MGITLLGGSLPNFCPVALNIAPKLGLHGNLHGAGPFGAALRPGALGGLPGDRVPMNEATFERNMIWDMGFIKYSGFKCIDDWE